MSHHAEFCDWCPWCFQGKGISRHHVQDMEDVENLGVTVSLDWTFVNSVENDSDESGPPTFVVHDNITLAIWASLRGSQEIADNLVDRVCLHTSQDYIEV